MARVRKGRAISGILLLDKPLGVSSNGILQRVKRLFGAAKAGHTGSLDPLASGLLPICLGEATKFSRYLLDSDKGYLTTATFGACSTTGDSEGDLVDPKPVAFSQERLQEVLESFRGPLSQIPPMYSALKVDGQPLYKLARQGKEIERKARDISILELTLLAQTETTADFRVRCTKGTYIRSLVEDIGLALDCGAYVSELRRFSAGPFETQQCYTIDQLEAILEAEGTDGLDALLLPTDTSILDWPQLCVGDEAAHELSFGRPVRVAEAPTQGQFRIYHVSADDKRFLGVAELNDAGLVAPKRLIVS